MLPFSPEACSVSSAYFVSQFSLCMNSRFYATAPLCVYDIFPASFQWTKLFFYAASNELDAMFKSLHANTETMFDCSRGHS